MTVNNLRIYWIFLTFIVFVAFVGLLESGCKESDNPPAGDEELSSSADADDTEFAQDSDEEIEAIEEDSSEEAGGSGQTVWENAGQVWTVSPEKLHEMLKTKDFLLINVYHGDEGQLPDTDTHIAHTDMDAIMTYIGDDKDRKTVLYCYRGLMSVGACDTLVAAGYTHVACLDGGLEAWVDAGYSLADE